MSLSPFLHEDTTLHNIPKRGDLVSTSPMLCYCYLSTQPSNLCEQGRPDSCNYCGVVQAIR